MKLRGIGQKDTVRGDIGTTTVFTAPLQNDFQWCNLYARQYGACTYAPPLPRNPSTTTRSFPRRRDVPDTLGGPGCDLRDANEAQAPLRIAHRSTVSRKESLFDISGNYCEEDETDYNNGGRGEKGLPPIGNMAASVLSSADNAGSSTRTVSSSAREGRAAFSPASTVLGSGSARHSRAGGETALDILLADGTLDPSGIAAEGDAFFRSDFFQFLRSPPQSTPSSYQTPLQQSPANESLCVSHSSSCSPSAAGASVSRQLVHAPQLPSGMLTLVYARQMNPHRVTPEIFRLHCEAWTLLMDNRALVWLEREAREKGRTAAQVRRRLLEVISAPPMGGVNGGGALPGVGVRTSTMMTAKRSVAFTAGGSSVIGGATASAATGRGDDKGSIEGMRGGSSSLTPQPPTITPLGAMPEPPPVSDEIAQQRVYDAFQPFFAVITPPAILRRLRDRFMAGSRAQERGQPGAAADLVGFPLFSQFATWREAYEHRRRWSNAPFSFFLIHDASFNYAQVTALFALLQVIGTCCHTHQPARCLAVPGGGGGVEGIFLQDASHLLGSTRSVRRAAEAPCSLCPLVAIQQVTEDILLAYEQSSSRTTLTMAMHVLGLLTDLVLDAETASRFVGLEALRRHSNFAVPGARGAASSHATSTEPDVAEGEDPADPLLAQRDSANGDGGCCGPRTGGSLAPKRFTDADFEALFGLSHWFLDAATANAGVPIEPALLPAHHPDRNGLASGGGFDDNAAGDARAVSRTLSASILPELSLSFGSAGSSPRGGGGRKGRVGCGAKSPQAASPTRSRAGGGGSASISMGTSLPPSGGPLEQHVYIPGRTQRYGAVGSLVEVMVLYEDARQRAEIEAQEAVTKAAAAVIALSVARASTSSGSPSSAAGGRRRSQQRKWTLVDDTEQKRKSTWQAAMAIQVPSPSTMLATPLVFITTYIRLHGAPWLKSLFGRLFNILRRESVVLYVNRLDLEGAFAHPATLTTSGPAAIAAPTVLASPKHSRPRSPGLAAPTTLATPPATSSSHGSRPGSAVSMNVLGSPRAMQASGASRAIGPLRHHKGSLIGRLLTASPSSSASTAVGIGQQHPEASVSNAAEEPPPSSAARPPRPAAVPDGAFFARMARLEELVSQDILYTLNEFLSALHGKRSATRLPQGITCLLTQFAASIHLHLLGNVVLAPEASPEYPGAAVRKVGESLSRLKQKSMAGKAARTESVGDSAVGRLTRSIEQFRLTKFILFDCWIIPALNNAVTMGYLAEGSSMHLRWNTDAFARYLKILVNAPFAEERSVSSGAGVGGGISAGAATSRRSDSLFSVTAGGSLGPAPVPLSHPRGGGDPRRVKESATTATTTEPLRTLALPRYITGVYDVASGCLVHASPLSEVYDATAGGSLLPLPRVAHGEGSDATEAATVAGSASGAVAGEGVVPQRPSAAAATAATARWRSSVTSTTTATELSGVPSRATPMPPRGADVQWRPAGSVFVVMDDASWESVPTAFKILNETLGVVGYDPEDLTDHYEGFGISGAGVRGSVRSSMADEAAACVDGACAMRVLDLFCRRASGESVHNVVVSEFEVLPSLAASCIDKIHEMMTGQHPLIEKALASGTLPSTFGFSPYLACLHGLLLHPKLAARALDNAHGNSSRFSHVLMRPVQDETLLGLASALVVDRGDLPLVDANALLPLLASVQAAGPGYSSVGPRQREPTSVPELADARVARMIWEAEARKLKQQRLFLATGAMGGSNGEVAGVLGEGSGHHSGAHMSAVLAALDRVGPPDPLRVLRAGAQLIVREARVVPLCFDVWWRAMALALCVKTVTVFAECSPEKSDAFDHWCGEQMKEAAHDNRRLRDSFLKQRGRTLDAAGLEQCERPASDRRNGSLGGGKARRGGDGAGNGASSGGTGAAGAGGGAGIGVASGSRSSSRHKTKRAPVAKNKRVAPVAKKVR